MPFCAHFGVVAEGHSCLCSVWGHFWKETHQSFVAMYGGSGGTCPDIWQTDEILKWIQDNDDSKGDIKSRVMGVVQANDLDGHTLRQLVAEKDEIQSLFPALKDRLAFKSMLRNLFKEEGKVVSIEPPSNITPKHSPPVPVSSYPHKLQVVTSFPTPPSSLRFPVTTTTRTYLPREGPTLPVRPRELHRAVNTHHQVTQKRTVVERQPLDTSSVLPKKIRDLIHPEKNLSLPSSVLFSMNPASSMNSSSTQPVYFGNQSMMSHPAKRQVLHHNDTSSSPVSRSSTSSYTAPTVTQTVTSIQLPTTPLEPPPQTSPQISSVTSYGLPSEKIVASNSWLVTSSNNSQTKPYRKPSSASAGFYRFINYPAPVPDFSDDVLECMSKPEGVRPSVRKRIMRDSAQFYVNISMGQRLNSNDYANIGRTLIEKFPALSCGGPIPWALFNKSLSQCIRNLRRRLKKSNGGFQSLHKVGDNLGSGSADAFDPNDLSDEEIEEVTCIEIGEGEEDEEQDVFFIKEELPAWTDDQVQ